MALYVILNIAYWLITLFKAICNYEVNVFSGSSCNIFLNHTSLKRHSLISEWDCHYLPYIIYSHILELIIKIPHEDRAVFSQIVYMFLSKC